MPGTGLIMVDQILSGMRLIIVDPFLPDTRSSMVDPILPDTVSSMVDPILPDIVSSIDPMITNRMGRLGMCARYGIGHAGCVQQLMEYIIF